MNHICILPLITAFSVATSFSASAAISRPVLELIEQYAKKYGTRVSAETAESINLAFLRYGDDALKAYRNGGPALAEAVTHHGDELVTIALRVPDAVPVLARRADELLPLQRRFGDDILRLEARTPGLAADAVRIFPDPGDIRRLSKFSPADASKTIAFANRADSPATARLLLEAVEKNGPNVLERLPAKQILAYGISASMVSAALVVSSNASGALFGTMGTTASGVVSIAKTFLIILAVSLGSAILVVALRLARPFPRTRRSRNPRIE
jgi:hypothetical protein